MKFEDAVQIYLDDLAEKHPNHSPEQPSRADSDLVNGVWYLRCAHHLLACVSVKDWCVREPCRNDIE